MSNLLKQNENFDLDDVIADDNLFVATTKLVIGSGGTKYVVTLVTNNMKMFVNFMTIDNYYEEPTQSDILSYNFHKFWFEVIDPETWNLMDGTEQFKSISNFDHVLFVTQSQHGALGYFNAIHDEYFTSEPNEYLAKAGILLSEVCNAILLEKDSEPIFEVSSTVKLKHCIGYILEYLEKR